MTCASVSFLVLSAFVDSDLTFQRDLKYFGGRPSLAVLSGG
jgi:hypothetical protein